MGHASTDGNHEDHGVMKCAVTRAAAWALRVALVFAGETIPLPGASIRSGCKYDYPLFCIVEEGGRANGFSVKLLRAALRMMDRDIAFGGRS